MIGTPKSQTMPFYSEEHFFKHAFQLCYLHWRIQKPKDPKYSKNCYSNTCSSESNCPNVFIVVLLDKLLHKRRCSITKVFLCSIHWGLNRSNTRQSSLIFEFTTSSNSFFFRDYSDDFLPKKTHAIDSCNVAELISTMLH